MKSQDYILRKIVRATSAAEAIRLDRKTPVHEVYQRDTDENKRLESCIGFNVHVEDGVPYEVQRKVTSSQPEGVNMPVAL